MTSRFALEGERKQVTVLFCDITNSTELAARVGAESMHVILHRFFEMALEEVHRFEGTVNQFLGDGYMALFGAPLAHEDHPRRGVLAALSVRHALREQQQSLGLPDGSTLQLRMGLHTGPVVVGSIGDNLRMDYTAIGDTTHLAARLQQAAAPGQIVMSDATARLVRGYVVSEPLTPLTLRGWPQPIQAFQLASLGSRRSRLDDDRTLTPFVGRDRELTILREALDDVEAGRGQVVGIVGEPGVGKSRLLHEFRRAIQGRSVGYVEGWCLSFGKSIPYLPLQDALRTTCGIAVADTPAQIGERVRSALYRAGLAGDELAPYLLQALGVKEGSDALAQISPETVKARTLETLQLMALSQSKQRTLVLAIEDLHWIDKISEEFLARLIDNLPGARILLITTARPGYVPPWQGKSYVTQLALRVLPTEAARRIVEAVTDNAPLSEVETSLIVRKAEGNPFFLEELSLALLEHQDLGLGQALPDTIQGVLAARIDRLPEAAKRTLQICAVLGREFPLKLLEAVNDTPEAARNQLDTLVQLEFLYERAEADGPAYVFKHALTQEVSYDGLLTSRREALHEAAGRGFEQIYSGRLEEHYEMLAHHYSHSGNAEKAIEYLDFANLKAHNANAVQDAQAYFNEALRQYARLADTVPRKRSRVALITRQAPVFMLQMKMVEYESLLRAAQAEAESLGDDALLGRFLACLGHCHWFSARYDEAVDVCLRAADLSERSGVWDGAAHGLMLVQWSHLYAGSFEKVVETEPHALRALQRAPHLRYRMWSLTASAWAYANMGRWSEAIERAERAMAEGNAVSDVSLVAFGAWIIGIGYVQKGELDEALHYGQLSVDKAPTPGDKAWGSNVLLWATLKRSPQDALEKLKPMWELFKTTGFKGIIAFCGVILSEAYLRTGQLPELQETAAAVRDLCQDCGQRFWEGAARRLLAEGLLLGGSSENEEAGNELNASIRLLQQCSAEPELARAYECYGRLRERFGDIAGARDYLSRALEKYERLEMLIEPDSVRRKLATL
ncbi:MAG TPA: AAA family ATPase [Steroidobacteraceae bacterium]|nr:AAA family ATPase [Steroidobacteraceae bacterium]